LRRTRLSLAALAVASSAVLGLPTVALAAPGEPASESAAPAADTTASAAPTGDAATPTGTDVASDTGTPTDAGSTADTEPAAAETPAAVEAAPTETPAATTTETPAETPAAEVAAAEAPVAAAAAPATPVQVLAMNDFHGRISPQAGGDGQLLTTGTGPGPDGQTGTSDDGTELVGGAAYIAKAVQDAQTSFVGAGGAAASSWFVGAGDLVSASPFNSSVFKDEPTIEVLNALGLDYSSVGNHEFDRGLQELYRVSAATDGSNGDDVTACEGIEVGVTGCFGDEGHEFEGADFPYLAANVVRGTGAAAEPILPPYALLDAGDGKRVALIGVVTTDTPNIVSPTGIAGLTFLDEADTVNRYADELTAPDFPGGPVNAIGVLVHEGGTVPSAPNSYNGCVGALAGTPIEAINAAIDPSVDFIVSAHTHVPYNCSLPVPNGEPRMVTQAGFYGKAITDIRFSLDAAGEVMRSTATATNVPVRRTGVTPDPRVQAIVAYWEARAAEEGSVSVGSQTADLDRAYLNGATSRERESALGNLVADAQLAYAQATASLGGADVDVAFMNPGGLRADINCVSTGAGDPDGNITYAETFAVQPFSNTVNTVDLTGAGIEQVLEQQWATRSGAASFLQLSVSGLTYEFDARNTSDRIDPASIRVGGQLLSLTATYKVAANSFLIAGGDSFTAFVSGRPAGAVAVTGGNDVDAFNAYVLDASPVGPPALDRASSLDPANSWDDDGSGAGSCSPVAAPGGTPVATPLPTPGPEPTAQVDGGAVAHPMTPDLQGVVATRGSGSTRGSLAYTGAPVTGMLGLGGALVAGGGVLMAAGYRRRRGLAD